MPNPAVGRFGRLAWLWLSLLVLVVDQATKLYFNNALTMYQKINAGFDMLSNNAGGGIAQFFDRDAPAEMAQVAMQGFQQFMVDPSTLDQVLQILEGARQRIY